MAAPEALAERLLAAVLGPLTVGGDVTPLAPLGERRAEDLAAAAPVLASAAAHEFHEQRARRVRQLLPLDLETGPLCLTAGEWRLAAALNDLLQVPSASLTGWLGPTRRRRLLSMALRTAQRAGAPATVSDAILRFATFAGLARLQRHDARVSWWAGQASYVGARPPERLLAWPDLRRVQVEGETRRPLQDGAPEGLTTTYAEAVRAWYAATPLLDLWLSPRLVPEFRWTGATLAVLAETTTRTVAVRLVAADDRREGIDDGIPALRFQALESATRVLRRQGPEPAADLARGFLDELRGRWQVSGPGARP